MLFYFDPLYWRIEGYGVDVLWNECERLAEILHRLQGKAVVSFNDHPDIRRLFAGVDIVSLQFSDIIDGDCLAS